MSLFSLLKRAAEYEQLAGSKSGILFYPSDFESEEATFVSYKTLLEGAKTGAAKLDEHVIVDGKVVVIYLDTHVDSISWFWRIVAAGAIPCILSTLPKDNEQKKKKLLSLQRLLENPLFITTEALVCEFGDIDNLSVISTTKIWALAPTSCNKKNFPGEQKNSEDLAVLILTSGSTGNSKAVCLTHGQILFSLKGKSAHHKTTKDDVFMNWIGLDHVANLTEMHLSAVYLGAFQLQVPSAAFLSEPTQFLKLAHKHKVTYTFAFNSFLAKLVIALESRDISVGSSENFDFSSLRALISGGEATVVETCVKLTKLLKGFGAPDTFIRPGFGMTETCAGSIYNAEDCPVYDTHHSLEFTNLGKCVPGIQMRIVSHNVARGDSIVNEAGFLEVSGPIVFKKYYNDEEGTKSSFTADGWFKTGDMASIDPNGRLRLMGRGKDTISINGNNHSPDSIAAAIDESRIPGLKPSFTIAFSIRPPSAETELLVVIYRPTYELNDAAARFHTSTAISKAVILYSGIRPYKIIPLDESFLVKSALGKLSRAKIRQAFENGEYVEFENTNEQLIHEYKPAKKPATTQVEKLILEICFEQFSTTDIGVDDDIFEVGASSMDLIQIKHAIQKSQLLVADFPITLFFQHKIIKDFAKALTELQLKTEFDPVVVFQSNGTQTPLFFFHPGMGEVLIFMNIARYFPDRPVYALRARGFDDEPYFNSMAELVSVYHAGIKRHHPSGPYALAGYSFGSFPAHEIAKAMEAAGDKVEFMAVLDQAPFQKTRAAGYDWVSIVLSLAFFLGLMDEKKAMDLVPNLRMMNDHEAVLDYILAQAPKDRLEDLGLSRGRLDRWAHVALSLKKLVSIHEPSGTIANLDVFYTEPLTKYVASQTTQAWYDDVISKWTPFGTDTKFHYVEGGHRNLIMPPYHVGFIKAFKAAMEARGL